MNKPHKKAVLVLLDNPMESDQRVEKEARSLMENGFDVCIVACQGDGFATDEERQGLRIIRMLDEWVYHPLRKGYFQNVRAAAKTIAALNYPIVHCNDIHMLVLGAAVKRLSPNTKLIYDAHEFLKGWPYYQDNKTSWLRFKGKLVWQYLLHLERKYIKKADGMITTSTAMAKAFQKRYNLAKTPSALRNIPQYWEPAPGNRYLREKFNIAREQVIMVHWGNIQQTDEQLVFLLETIRSTPSLSAVFVGNRSPFFKLQDRVNSNSELKSQIFFEEYNPGQLAQVLSGADFGLSFVRTQWASLYLTTVNRIMEYSICSLPIVSTPQSTAEELNAQFGHILFFPQESNEHMKKAILEMVEQIDAFRKKAENIHQHLSWQSDFEHVLDLYTNP